MRARELEIASRGVPRLDKFNKDAYLVPEGVSFSTYRTSSPLVKTSKLTSKENGGVGKELSDGWVANYATGCTHGCKFCYVDAIHKKFGQKRVGSIVYDDWGDYFAIPSNLDEVIENTKWKRWSGTEVMLSSTHDPYLPQVNKYTRKILEKALPEGVKFCIQTRNPLVERDMELISQYRDQVRLQVSIASMNEDLSRAIEPRVVKPERRLQILEKAREHGLNTGVIIAPVFPELKIRPHVYADIKAIASRLETFRPDHIYGESLHLRGINIAYVEDALGQAVNIDGFDKKAEEWFHKALSCYNLKGIWWKEF
ncbi:hypothetical protein IX51_04735 [uncultured archaeon]|nr:hypothetical protein IX51_04735 [uncultured archaeon]